MGAKRIRFREKKKVALCLSGGGIKAAAFHVGACLALEQKGFRVSSSSLPHSPSEIPVQLYVGSSAGAIVSAVLASGYSVGALIEAFQMGQNISAPRRLGVGDPHLKPLKYWNIFHPNARSMVKSLPGLLQRPKVMTGGFEALLKTLFKINGFFTMDGIEAYMRSHVLKTNNFRELPSELYIVATQLNHSRKVIFGPYEKTEKKQDIGFANYATISQAVAASASLPPAFAPYGIPNEKGKTVFYFDGEIRDTLSTHVAFDHGADLVISSYSIQPYHYNKAMGSLHEHGIPLIANQALYQVIEQKIRNHRKSRVLIGELISLVDSYFKQNNLPHEHKDKLLELLYQRANYNPDVDFIDIHPHPQDYEMFFFDHFSLNPTILSKIVKIGFRSAIRTLRHHDL